MFLCYVQAPTIGQGESRKRKAYEEVDPAHMQRRSTRHKGGV